jgi:hypothetical protein
MVPQPNPLVCALEPAAATDEGSGIECSESAGPKKRAVEPGGVLGVFWKGGVWQRMRRLHIKTT